MERNPSAFIGVDGFRIALASSDAPRKVSKQAFHIFPKIREIDTLLRERGALRVHEVYPEFALRALNDGQPMTLPKKIKGAVNPDGIRERESVPLAAELRTRSLRTADRDPGMIGWSRTYDR